MRSRVFSVVELDILVGLVTNRVIPSSDQWRIHRGGDGGDRPPYGFKKIFFLNIYTVKYWKIVDILIQVVKITPKTHHPKKSPPVIHAGSYLRRRNRPENFSNYPLPRIHGTSSTTPPRNRAGKLLQLPPSNSRNFIDYPPLEIGPENYRPLLLDDLDPPLVQTCISGKQYQHHLI